MENNQQDNTIEQEKKWKEEAERQCPYSDKLNEGRYYAEGYLAGRKATELDKQKIASEALEWVLKNYDNIPTTTLLQQGYPYRVIDKLRTEKWKQTYLNSLNKPD